MPILRMQCTWQQDSGNPTDGITITPHFKDVNVPFTQTDIQNLTNDLATALDVWTGLKSQLTVKAYDAQHLPPNYPLATSIKRSGTVPAATVNRDVAVCLSYYATNNRPRSRGRLYIPVSVMAVSPSGAFVPNSTQTTVSNLVPIFTGLGGIDVDWVVFSRRDNTSRPITNWFIDNSWDTQRRRGTKPTGRMVGTTTEGDLPNLVSMIAGVPSDELEADAAA